MHTHLVKEKFMKASPCHCHRYKCNLDGLSGIERLYQCYLQKKADRRKKIKSLK